MIYVAHRINTLEKLKKVPEKCGVEIDIRGNNGKLLLSHDPISDDKKYVELDFFLQQAMLIKIPFFIFNIKEAGYESDVIKLAKKYKIKKNAYFLLDVEYPYMYKATRKEGVRQLAVRYSEGEPIEYAEAQIYNGKTLLDWVWIDTNTRLPLDKKTIKRLEPFKKALVCPERWGRPQDINTYALIIKKLNAKIDLIMTSIETIPMWQKHNL